MAAIIAAMVKPKPGIKAELLGHFGRAEETEKLALTGRRGRTTTAVFPPGRPKETRHAAEPQTAPDPATKAPP